MCEVGYIKYYRKSIEDEMYFKEPFTKWQAWMDLITLALWKDEAFFIRGIRIVGKRGCVYKSQKTLCERWMWSRTKVLRFLSYLSDVNKIELKTIQQNSRLIGCISIVNYEKYQSNDTTDDTTDDTTNDTTNDTTEQKEKEISPFTPYKEKEKKEKEEGKEENSSSLARRARTREKVIFDENENFVKMKTATKVDDREKQFLTEMKTDEPWLEVVCMKFHRSRSDIVAQMNNFMLDCECRKSKHNNLADMQRHFCDWLRIQFKIQTENENRNTRQTTSQRLEDAATLVHQLLNESEEPIPDDVW